MARLLSGKDVAAGLNDSIRADMERLKEKGITPRLAIVRVGEADGDIAYERGAVKRCEALGIAYEKFLLPADCATEDVLRVIGKINDNDAIHGCLLFRPLPNHLDEEKIANALDAAKDADGMTERSIGAVFTGRAIGYPPCTPQACMEILKYYGYELSGKNVVVIGRSLVVGKPVAMLCLRENATVTVCHTKTVDMPAIARQADILIVAAGRARIIGAEYVRAGQTVLDVGINTDADGKLCGDVDTEAVEKIVDAVTPVPGGVGAVTTAVLLRHVVDAAMRGVV